MSGKNIKRRIAMKDGKFLKASGVVTAFVAIVLAGMVNSA